MTKRYVNASSPLVALMEQSDEDLHEDLASARAEFSFLLDHGLNEFAIYEVTATLIK